MNKRFISLLLAMLTLISICIASIACEELDDFELDVNDTASLADKLTGNGTGRPKDSFVYDYGTEEYSYDVGYVETEHEIYGTETDIYEDFPNDTEADIGDGYLRVEEDHERNFSSNFYMYTDTSFSHMRPAYLQKRDNGNGTFDIRIITALKSRKYTAIDYRLSIESYSSFIQSSTKTLSVSTAYEKLYDAPLYDYIYPHECGASYFSAFVIKGISNSGKCTITVDPTLYAEYSSFDATSFKIKINDGFLEMETVYYSDSYTTGLG